MFNTSNTLRLMVAFWALHIISAQYPKCYKVDANVWSEADYTTIDGADHRGIPSSKVRGKCRTACRADLNTFCGMKRNGPKGGFTRCYCGDDLQNLHNGNICNYTCEGGQYACGGSASMSVFSVCTTGKYGPTCSSNCPVNCFEDVCQVSSGDCLTGCKTGSYGETCTQSCGNCRNGCTQSEGKCEPGGCKTGFYGEKCDQTCPVNCGGNICMQSDGACSNCNQGYHGKHCDQSCPNCKEGCEQDNGVCKAGGCKSGFYGEKCDQTCRINCGATDCIQSDGGCFSCDQGYYGKYCDQSCTNCKEGCEQDDDGVCKAGGCKGGFHGSKCDLSCPSNCQDGRCRQDDGVCDSCQMGYHGDNCDKVCNCLKGCQQVSGICELGGCFEGYFGEKCDMSCPNCDGGCQQDNGSCISGCRGGSHGDKCDMSCSNCDGGCKQDTGSCINGCHVGYHGDKCDIDCPEGCFDQTCFRGNGTCADCKRGFYNTICDLTCPKNCKDNTCNFKDGSCMVEENGLTAGEKAGISIAVIIVLAGVIIGVFFLYRRMNKLKAVSSARNFGFDDLENEQRPTKPELPVHPLVKPVSPIVKPKALSSASNNGSDDIVDDQRQPKSEIPVLLPVKPVPQIHKPKAASSARNLGSDMEIEQRLSIFPPEKPIPETVPAASGHTYEDFQDPRPKENAKIIAVKDFPRYVSSRMVPKDMFEDEYESLPSEQLYPWDAAHVDESLKLKNRFKDIYPYDYNRVVLSKLTNDPFSDYINASRMKGFHPEDAFIATLAPRKLTVNDFWRMIWQEKVDTVVMVTNLVELGAPKCVQYWPDVGCSFMFGKLNVELYKEDAWPHYAIRRMAVTKGNVKRTVVQYHFTVWPDHGVPDAVQLLNFRRKISPKIGQGKPVIIHCSAGVGRTGTLIALDYLIKQAEKQGSLDVYNCVYTLRHQRKSIIQTAEQYAFLHEALAVYFELQGDTVVTADNLLAVKPAIIGSKTTGRKSALEYKMLAKLDPQQMAYDRDYPLDPANINKNRDHKILPRMKKRVFLSRSKGGSDYINAVTVDSFCKIDAYYVTHPPLANTVQDFWTMMDDSDSRSIVMLLTQKQKQEMPQFLPTKNKPLNIQDKMASAENSHTRDGHYKTLTINVASPGKTNQEPPKEILTEPAENQYMNVTEVKEKPLEKTWSAPEADSKQIKVFEITIAGDSDLIDVNVILGVYQDVQKWQLENSNQPIIVMCMNGARYSGQYVGCCNVFEMISGDQEVDVFQVAKYIRESRPEFLLTQAQYNNLYEAAALYLQQNSLDNIVYQNIQTN